MILPKSTRSFLSPPLMAMILLAAQALAQDGVLHEGTPVRVKLNRTVSSATEHQGDRIDFEVIDDIKSGNTVVIPHGSTALATVTEAIPKGRMGKGGKLNVNVDSVRLPNGDRIALRGVQETKGGGHTGAMTGAMVGTAIVFWPAAPLFLLMHGKDITIPQGHEVTVYTNADYKAVASNVSTLTNMTMRGSALTNSDILKLREVGLGDQILITKIKGTPGNSNLRRMTS